MLLLFALPGTTPGIGDAIVRGWPGQLGCPGGEAARGLGRTPGPSSPSGDSLGPPVTPRPGQPSCPGHPRPHRDLVAEGPAVLPVQATRALGTASPTPP